MKCAVMGNLDGDLTKVAFDFAEIRRIIHLDGSEAVLSHDRGELFLKIEEDICRVENLKNNGGIGPYFIVLNSSEAFSIKDYRIIFEIQELSEGLLYGKDVSGKVHLCKRYRTPTSSEFLDSSDKAPINELSHKLKTGQITEQELEQLKELIDRLKRGEFYEALTKEVSGKIKEIALELIEFRKDLQSKIEPNIVDLAQKDIPEASNQLEGINETLEKSTMKIMDINEEQMEIANQYTAKIRDILEDFSSEGGEDHDDSSSFQAKEVLERLESTVKELPEHLKELEELLGPSLLQAKTKLSQGDHDGVIQAIEVVAKNVEILSSEDEPEDQIKTLTRYCQELNEAVEAINPEAPKRVSVPLLQELLKGYERIGRLSLNMLEPLSFQDLVGQRIQRIVKLVKTMETRIEDLVISFGVKLQKHKTDPNLSYEEIAQEAEQIRSELKGPSREGEGLDQAAVDELLASL